MTRQFVRSAFATALGLLAPLPVSSQPCGAGAGPTYEDFARVLRNYEVLGLDTLSMPSSREVTVVLPEAGSRQRMLHGAPSDQMRASAFAACRVSALWTSRGDSLSVNWVVRPQIEDLIVPQFPEGSLSQADQPRPRAFTTGVAPQFPQAYRAILAEARERAQGDVGTGTTMLLTLIDETGRPIITRLLVSSGRRSLDETALGARMLGLTTSSDSVGVDVPRWYVTPISWRE
jgi:hypothetical protein